MCCCKIFIPMSALNRARLLCQRNRKQDITKVVQHCQKISTVTYRPKNLHALIRLESPFCLPDFRGRHLDAKEEQIIFSFVGKKLKCFSFFSFFTLTEMMKMAAASITLHPNKPSLWVQRKKSQRTKYYSRKVL